MTEAPIPAERKVKSAARLEHVAARILNRPLMILPTKLDTIVAVLAGHLGVEIDLQQPELGLELAERPEPLSSRFVGRRAENDDGAGLPFLRTEAGVGLVTVTGSLCNRGAWVGAYSGLTSYEGIAAQLRAAAADRRTTSIMLDMNTGGGEAIGAFELATLVREVDAAKPVTAFVNGIAASAGYMIASGARRIVSIPSGMTGSIGVVIAHADYSGALQQKGVKVTFIHAGKHKVEGNSYEPLDADTKARLQAEVEAMRKDFAAAVGSGRGSRFSAQAALDTEARVFDGREAKALGLVDEVATFDALLDTMTRGAGPSRTPASRRATMNYTQADLDAARTDGHKAGLDEGKAAGRAEGIEFGEKKGHAAGLKDGATAERTRLKSILGAPEAKGREGLATHFAYDTEFTAETAVSALKASAKTAVGSLAERASAAIVGLHTGGTDRGTQKAVTIDAGAIYAERNKVG